ncbi:hypothetical protein Q9189_006393 [Teloschistes chrysophthalmus]
MGFALSGGCEMEWATAATTSEYTITALRDDASKSPVEKYRMLIATRKRYPNTKRPTPFPKKHKTKAQKHMKRHQKEKKKKKRPAGCGSYQKAGSHPLSRLLQLPAPLFASGIYFLPVADDVGEGGAREEKTD